MGRFRCAALSDTLFLLDQRLALPSEKAIKYRTRVDPVFQ
jgi:hypothetical protein